MATVAAPVASRQRQIDVLSGTPRAHAVDRWIYVFTAASFIVITLTGFIPDSLMKVEMVRAGLRPPFPMVLHAHAVLMGSFLLLLFAQTWLMAMGRTAHHMQLGIVGVILAAALVVVGFILAPTMYHQLWEGAQQAPSPMREQLQSRVLWLDNILLLQIRIGLLFPLFLAIAFRARGSDAGLHKRMMILATAVALPAAIDRISWLPTTLPQSPIAADLYTMLAVSPMFVWDLARNRYIHRAYWIWLGLLMSFGVVVNLLWDTPWWHATARQIMGV